MSRYDMSLERLFAMLGEQGRLADLARCCTLFVGPLNSGWWTSTEPLTFRRCDLPLGHEGDCMPSDKTTEDWARRTIPDWGTCRDAILGEIRRIQDLQRAEHEP